MRIWASDRWSRAGFNNDPAEVDGWAAWLRIGPWELFLYKRAQQRMPRLGLFR